MCTHHVRINSSITNITKKKLSLKHKCAKFKTDIVVATGFRNPMVACINVTHPFILYPTQHKRMSRGSTQAVPVVAQANAEVNVRHTEWQTTQRY